MNILIVDDEVVITSMLLRHLLSKGHMVSSTNLPEEVISMERPGAFDVVITDLIMKPVNGFDIISHLRNTRFSGRIILMTGSCSEDEIDKDTFQIDAFLSKPFDFKALDSKLQEWA